MIIVLWSGIEVVITRLTRNQLYSNVPWVRIPPAPPLRNDLCMSDDRLGRVHLDSKGLSSFKLAATLLGGEFVFGVRYEIRRFHGTFL